MSKYTNFTIGILTGLTFLFLFNLSSFAYRCETIRTDTIRLHVIAQSDNEIDQNIKLMVRDAVLKCSPEIFDGTVTTENAKDKIIPNINKIKETADTVIKNNNSDYTADVTLTTEYFDTRVYDNGITLPAGNYLALKITLGEGKGKNWWCIMFPSLCLPAADNNDNIVETFYSEEEKEVLLNTNKYEIRFKIIEYIEKIKDKVDNTHHG